MANVLAEWPQTREEKYWKTGDRDVWGRPHGMGTKCENVFVLYECSPRQPQPTRLSKFMWTKWSIMWMPVNFCAQTFQSLLKRPEGPNGHGSRHGDYLWTQQHGVLLTMM